MLKRIFGLIVLIVCSTQTIFATRPITQLPSVLSNGYINLQVGGVDYPFSNTTLAPGYKAQSIDKAPTALRLNIGSNINKYLSAQISLMRPVHWVKYSNINDDQSSHSVWMSVFGITLLPRLPITDSFSIYGEGGVALVSRNGVVVRGVTAISNQDYASYLVGGGLKYAFNPHWSVNAGAIYTPAKKNISQPHTFFAGAGFQYTMLPLSDETVAANLDAPYYFPLNILQLGYSTNQVGYGANRFWSKSKVPLFWFGDVRIKNGFQINYQRNVFHTEKYFSLDVGASYSLWKTKKNHTSFSAISLYPIFRFWLLRSSMADMYFYYSIAGPTYVSQKYLDDKDTGKQFTFQDYMGIGFFLGKSHRINMDFKIAHYSNGNLFSQNVGVAVPIVWSLGFAF